jgi:hypothetical protein
MTDVQGMLTSSDLELAGTVVQHEATAANFDVLERTIVNGTSIPPLATVEFNSSVQAPPSSNTNAWTQKRNPAFFQDKPKTRCPNKTTFTPEASSVAESTNTAPTLATQLSHTEALIDSELATFRTEIEFSFSSHLNETYERLVAPLIHKFDTPSKGSPGDSTQPNTEHTVPPPHHHHNAYHYQRYASREPDTISIHTQSVDRPLPPHGYPYLGPPITY